MPRFQTLTVAQLRALLADVDQNARVVFTADYGDHSHTPQALLLSGEIEEDVALSETAYSTSGWRLREEDFDPVAEEEDGEDPAPRVVVIR